jgi:hypothetical protein
VAVAVRVSSRGDTDWGGADPANIEAVAVSAAQCFPVLQDEDVAITLLPMTKGPMTIQDRGLPDGEAIVWLSVQGNLWAKLAYQFAHEFCHVIADPRTLPWDRFLWIEEAICETASLFALRCMAKTWAEEPPYPNWSDYGVRLDDYARERIEEPDRCVPAGVTFRDWLADRLPLLEENPGRRDDNAIVAKELLSLFEAEPTLWRAIRYLHSWPRPAAASWDDFFDGWATACRPESREGVRRLGDRLDVAA